MYKHNFEKYKTGKKNDALFSDPVGGLIYFFKKSFKC